MKFISSDTNVWSDFSVIDKLAWPFLLPYQYIMNNDAIENELLSPVGLKKSLLDLGLQPVELMEEEFYLTESFVEKIRDFRCMIVWLWLLRKIGT